MRVTNMRNRQICTVGDLHLIRAGVAFLDGHPTHVVGEVIGGAGVEEPGLAVGCCSNWFFLRDL